SDAIVDHVLQKDPYANIIAECAVATAIVFIAARFATSARIDYANIAREVISQVDYDERVFNAKTCSVITSLTEMPVGGSPLVDERTLDEEMIERISARNQVTVFGFACNQTAAFIPLPIWLAHRLARKLVAVRCQKALDYLAPDGKTQVGIEYCDGKPSRVHSITIIASQKRTASKGGPDAKRLQDDIRETVLSPIFQDEEIKPDANTRIFVNPDGAFIGGGPAVHSGLTGRKNAIDTYGEYSRHSGAALSGKDPSRIDRIGAYAARYAAKNIVAAGLATSCEVQLSYSIGFSRPVSIQVETFGTGKVSDQKIADIIENNFDFRPAGIIRHFNLRYLPAQVKGGFYRKLAAYGHVGRMDIGLPWELTDKINAIKG
ncbi:MAG TPA: methionine adenosyltransferase, partial [Nitrospirota bacterium]|nr:methionine adenosyltransferase [Nitrospirota bacterium]